MEIARRRRLPCCCRLLVLTAAISLPFAAAAAQEPLRKLTTDDVLGFSRYLPTETTGYISLLQAGNVRTDIAGSRAWAKVTAVPEVGAALEKAREALSSDDFPPPARAALDLAGAMFSSEATMATTTETSRQLVNLVRVIALGVPALAPTRAQPGSPEAEALERIRGPMRTDWLSAVQDFRVPPLIFAWRVREIERYRPFIDMAVAQGWRAALAEFKRVPPPVRAALEGAYSQTTVGRSSAHRLRLRVGDVLTPPQIEQALRDVALSDAERTLLANTLAGLGIEIHLAYVGDYLTLVISHDDSVVRAIVRRFEGNSAETLAAAPAFAALRREMKPESLLVVYSDGEQAQRDLLRILLPLLDQLSDPQLSAALGAPPTLSSSVQSLKFQLMNIAAASPIRQEAVIVLDQGLKQTARLEFDAPPRAVAATALAVPKFVPAGATAFSAYRYASFAPLGQQLKLQLEEALGEFAAVRERYAEVPEVAARLDRRSEAIRRLIELVDTRLSGIEGEAGIVLGPFAKFSLRAPGGPTVENIPVPTLAVAIGSADSRRTFEGLTELIQAAIRLASIDGDAGPVRLIQDEIGGISIRGLPPGMLPMRGFEPHLALVGDFVFFSTSHELTMQMRDAQAGKTGDVTSAAAYRAKQDYFPDSAEQLTFVNGETFHAELQRAAGAIFDFLEANREALNIRDAEVAQIERIESWVATSLEVLHCFRGAASSIVIDGSTHNLLEWVHVEDLAP